MTKLTIIIATLCICTIFAASSTLAATHFKIATINIPPYVYIDPITKTTKGSMVDELRKRAQVCGITLEFIVSPSWSRAYTMAQAGTADGLVPTNYTESRTHFFDYAQPALTEVNSSVIVRKSSQHYYFTGLSMLEGKRIAKRTNGVLGNDFERFIRSGKAQIIDRSTTKDLAEALLSGKADFMVANPVAVAYHLGADQVSEKMRILSPSLGASVQYLALSKKRSALFASETNLSKCLLGPDASQQE